MEPARLGPRARDGLVSLGSSDWRKVRCIHDRRNAESRDRHPAHGAVHFGWRGETQARRTESRPQDSAAIRSAIDGKLLKHCYQEMRMPILPWTAVCRLSPASDQR